MSLIPNKNRSLFSQRKKGGDLFNWSHFFENFDQDLMSAFPHQGVSVSSDDKNIYVEADVPGLNAKEIEVSIDNNHTLWIKGEKKEEESDKSKKYYKRSLHSYSYCLPLFDEIDESCEPDAVCKDGVMKITFAKKKENQAESKKIQVKEDK